MSNTYTFLFERPDDLDTNDLATWINGLRSGKYTQHRNCMCDFVIPDTACCLHVAAIEVDGIEWSDGVKHGLPSSVNAVDGMDLSFSVQAEGLRFQVIKPTHNVPTITCGASSLNDEYCLTFEHIAELLEKGKIEVDLIQVGDGDWVYLENPNEGV